MIKRVLHRIDWSGIGCFLLMVVAVVVLLFAEPITQRAHHAIFGETLQTTASNTAVREETQRVIR